MKTFREHDLTARAVPPAPRSSREQYSSINTRDMVENGGAHGSGSVHGGRPPELCLSYDRAMLELC